MKGGSFVLGSLFLVPCSWFFVLGFWFLVPYSLFLVAEAGGRRGAHAPPRVSPGAPAGWPCQGHFSSWLCLLQYSLVF